MNNPGSGSDGGPFSRSRRRQREAAGRPIGPLFAGLALAAVLGFAAWWWFGYRGSASDPTPPAADRGAATEPAEPAEPLLDVPELDESDPVLRQVLAQVSTHPEWAKWLVTDDLARRFVAAVVNVAGGESPREHVDFLEPEGSFQVREAGDAFVADPASYRRYDLLRETFVSLDPTTAARWYRLLHPLFEEAHQELGLRDRTFDQSMAMAVGALLSVQVPEGEVTLVQNEAVYEYADPNLEALPAAEKHLLRLGPSNARQVQDQLRDVAAAIGIDPVSPPGGN